ncbi:hypothetical protein MRB53_009879 [Persea americana]|uniref:Uncharacterized protein n=1 Tax=Persea americana TaxID=3435 RepID=A0ACC2LRA6_PERAE|nr:hypothetical protein MRB53_009879 [Persea americana]
MGEALVRHLRSPPSKTEHLANEYLRETTKENVNQGNGKFVVLHLRFDKKINEMVMVEFWFLQCRNWLGLDYTATTIVITMLHSMMK